MESGNGSGKTLPILILNACPDIQLRGIRAKILNDAGYYTTSARTSQEVSQLSTRMNCALAVVCYSFSEIEQRAMRDQLHQQSPATRLVLLDHAVDEDPKNFLARIKKALYKLEIVTTDEKSA